MASPWVFDRVADGLLLGARPPRRHLSRLHRHGVLLDASGAPMPTRESAAAATTWRSHHAFSGRCGLSLEPATHGGGEARVSGAAADYRTWMADFRLQSTSSDPHILLSVAPHYNPPRGNLRPRAAEAWRAPSAEEQDTHDRRMLETPLIWEEPMAVSVDCTASGMFLWSGEWGIFGEKVADRCLERPVGAENGHDRNHSNDPEATAGTEGLANTGAYEALLRLRWQRCGKADSCDGERSSLGPHGSPHSDSRQGGRLAVYVCDRRAGERVAEEPPAVPPASGTDGGERACSGAHAWRRVWERSFPMESVADEVYFTPYVTLMDEGDQVTLL